MKLPGVGEVKNNYVLIGGGVIGGYVLLAYYRKRKASQATVSTDATMQDPSAVDPNTGLTYGQEGGQYSGYYTNQTAFNPYVGQTGTVQAGSTGTYTDNTAWISDAEQDAVGFYGASSSLASSALGKYIAQDPAGLNPDEYSLVSEIVAQIGQPPIGQPYRLIKATPTQNPPPSGGGGTDVPPGYHMQPDQYATLSDGTTLRTYARWNSIPGTTNTVLSNLETYNPGLNPDDKHHGGTIKIRTSRAHLVPN